MRRGEKRSNKRKEEKKRGCEKKVRREDIKGERIEERM